MVVEAFFPVDGAVGKGEKFGGAVSTARKALGQSANVFQIAFRSREGRASSEEMFFPEGIAKLPGIPAVSGQEVWVVTEKVKAPEGAGGAELPGSSAWYALRRTLVPWRFEETLRELVEYLPRYRVEELIVKVDTEEFSHGQPPLEWVRAYRPRLEAVREAMAEIGVRYSVNPWISVGHCDRGRDSRSSLPGLQTMVGHDGTECTSCACPLSEVWRAHVRAVWREYAATRPHVIWVEDDIRTFNHEPVRFSCFCPLHLARFSERVGHRVEREELVGALLGGSPGGGLSGLHLAEAAAGGEFWGAASGADEGTRLGAIEPHPWRAVFLDLQGELMVETVRFLAGVVHEVSPETRLGLMSSGPLVHCLEGRRWGAFAEALADGRPLYSRPPLGSYHETSLRGLYYSQDSIKLTRHCLPVGTIEQTEVENAPFTQYSKSATFTFLQMATSFAYGSKGVTLNLFDHRGTPMEWDAVYGRMLGEKKAFLEALASRCGGPGRHRGVQLLFDEKASYWKRLRSGAAYDELIADGAAMMEFLEVHGLPTTYEDESVVATCGQMIRGYSDDAIRRMLSAGMLLDGPAARVLVERGFGEWIGLKEVGEGQSIDDWGALAAEENFDPELGGEEGKYLSLTFKYTDPRALVHRLIGAGYSGDEKAAGARWVTRLVDPDRRVVAPGMVVHENKAGGRVAIMTFDLASILGVRAFHPFRAELLGQVCEWLSRGRLPIFVECDGAYPMAFRKDFHAAGAAEADEGVVVGVFNLTLDPWRYAEFRLGDVGRIDSIEVLNTEGEWRAAGENVIVREESGGIAVRVGRPIAFREPLVLALWR